MRILIQTACAVALVAVATVAGLTLYDHLGMAGAIPIYLLPVLFAAYYWGPRPSVAAAVAAFFALNYFFVEPRFTFEVAQPQSWAALAGLLLVSLVVTSLVRRLKAQTVAAERASAQAKSARRLAEGLAGVLEVESVLRLGCGLLHETLGSRVVVASPSGGGGWTLWPEGFFPDLDLRACRWVVDTGKMAGPGSGNWPDSMFLIVPLDRLPGSRAVLVFGDAGELGNDVEIAYLRGLVDQIALACQRAITLERSEAAQRQAREESLRGAFLASIAHDMRTPLTAILGAATSLQQQGHLLDETQRQGLLESLSAESRYLANATENVLALVRLEAGVPLRLDWQSLEEIVGTTFARYRGRSPPPALRADVQVSARLIRADASLLSQALSNLIDNALTVQPSGEPVVVSVREEADEQVLSVHDDGPGFSTDFDVTRIRKFERGPARGRGYGLGLAIVQAIAQTHEARFDIRNRLPAGATVSLRFAASDIETGSP